MGWQTPEGLTYERCEQRINGRVEVRHVLWDPLRLRAADVYLTQRADGAWRYGIVGGGDGGGYRTLTDAIAAARRAWHRHYGYRPGDLVQAIAQVYASVAAEADPRYATYRDGVDEAVNRLCRALGLDDGAVYDLADRLAAQATSRRGAA